MGFYKKIQTLKEVGKTSSIPGYLLTLHEPKVVKPKVKKERKKKDVSKKTNGNDSNSDCGITDIFVHQ